MVDSRADSDIGISLGGDLDASWGAFSGFGEESQGFAVVPRTRVIRETGIDGRAYARLAATSQPRKNPVRSSVTWSTWAARGLPVPSPRARLPWSPSGTTSTVVMPSWCGTTRLRARSSNIADFAGSTPWTVEEFPVGLRRRLWLEFGGDDVEHRLEMLADAEPLQHRTGMVGRAVGQDQLAPRQFCDRRAHRRIGLQRRMVDLVHVGEIVVGAHAVLGHHAAHAGAVAAVIVLLDLAAPPPGRSSASRRRTRRSARRPAATD